MAIYLNRDDTPTTEPEFVGHVFRNESAEKLHELLSVIVPGAIRFSGGKMRQSWPGKKRTGAPTYAVIKPSLPRFMMLTVESSEQHPVVAGRTVTLFLEQPTVGVDMRANIAMDLVDYPPLVMPKQRQTAQLVHPNARASASGFTWQVSGPSGPFSFTVPDDRQIFAAILGQHGLHLESSAWGTAAQRALTVVGGLTGVSTLRDRIALRLLNVLCNIDRPVGGQPQVEPQPAMTMSELTDRLRGVVGVRGKNDVAPALDRLVAARLTFPGLKVRCPQCGADEWRVVDDLRLDMICLACRGPVPFRLREPTGRDPELAWSYRINQAIVWPAGQGVVPGLLLLAKLAPRAQFRFRHLMGQRLTGVLNCEVDAVLAVDRLVGVAEVKRPGALSAEEIERTIDVAARLDGVAYFATEAEEWTPETAVALESAQRLHQAVRIEAFALADLINGR